MDANASDALSKAFLADTLRSFRMYKKLGDAAMAQIAADADLLRQIDPGSNSIATVVKHLHDWFEEFRLYHRKDGKVVKEGDDLMAATRYAIMMLRFASTARSYHSFRRKIVYPKLGIA